MWDLCVVAAATMVVVIMVVVVVFVPGPGLHEMDDTNSLNTQSRCQMAHRTAKHVLCAIGIGG